MIIIGYIVVAVVLFQVLPVIFTLLGVFALRIFVSLHRLFS